MKHVVWKVFVNYEKEEKWLNEMSAKGLAMTGYTWCRYVFEESPQNEFIYRIELLKNPPAHAESAGYIKFLEDSGIECVDAYMRWIYLRKKSSDGDFDIYSDLDSKLTHYGRVRSLWVTLMFLELFSGFLNIFIGGLNLLAPHSISRFPFVNIGLGALLVAIGVLFFALTRQLGRRIKALKKEKMIRE
jgi:hypothetical protein